MVSICKHKISVQRLLFLLLLLFSAYTFFYLGMVPCNHEPVTKMVPNENHYIQNTFSNNTIYYDRNMALIFIGGMPRSGTTLMRVLLDTHPDVRCGEETRVIPRILGLRSHWDRSMLEKVRLSEAGITEQVLDSAVMSFILEIIAKHGHAAPRLCNKDPFTLKSSAYLSRLFPESKFVLMIRDGRAVVNSLITRKVSISGFDLKDFRGCMKKWNLAIEVMYNQCLEVGQLRCMPVYYEQLVLHPEVWLKQILKFLALPWTDAVLHHEDFVNKNDGPNGVKLSKTEKSTDQVIKPINLAALTGWVDNVPMEIRKDMASIAPMLWKLGYDPNAYPPEYGKPDNRVLDNTQEITQNHEYWMEKEKMIDESKNEALRKARLEASEKIKLAKT